MKGFFKKLSYLVLGGAIAVSYNVFSPSTASAAWKKAGITPSGSLDNPTLYEDLEGLVNIVMAIGGFWVILCLLFAGMKLAGAQGNPQNRTAGFLGLGMAAIGLFVIVKSYDIAGWIAGFGAN